MSIPKKQILSSTAEFPIFAAQDETIADFLSYFTEANIFERHVKILKAFITFLSKNEIILYKLGE